MPPRDVEASTEWRTALRLCANPPDLLLRVAGTVLAERPDASAVDHATQLVGYATARAPDDPGILTRAASLLFYAGAIDAAAEAARLAAARATPEFALAWDLVHITGRVAAARGQTEVAEELLADAFDAEPDSFNHGHALAELYGERGAHEQALAVVETALRHRPDDAKLLALRRRVQAARRAAAQ